MMSHNTAIIKLGEYKCKNNNGVYNFISFDISSCMMYSGADLENTLGESLC